MTLEKKFKEYPGWKKIRNLKTTNLNHDWKHFELKVDKEYLLYTKGTPKMP